MQKKIWDDWNLLTRAHFFWRLLIETSTQSQTNGQTFKTYNAIPQAGARNPIPKHLLVHFITNVHIIMLQCGRKSCSWPECKFLNVEALLQISKFDAFFCSTFCIEQGNMTLFFKISRQILKLTYGTSCWFINKSKNTFWMEKSKNISGFDTIFN